MSCRTPRRPTAPRRGRAATATTLLAVALVVTVGGCRGDHPREPTLGTIDVTPALVLEITDAGYAFRPGPRPLAGVTTDPVAVPSGTVMEVRNGTRDDQRLQGGRAFDTGIMRPDEHVTVVLTGSGDTDTVLEVRNVEHPGPTATITVRPPPA